MSAELQPLGRFLIIVGLILTVAGAVLLVSPKIPWIGRLPGDILIQRDRTTFYFPLTTSILLSILLSLLLWLFGKNR